MPVKPHVNINKMNGWVFLHRNPFDVKLMMMVSNSLLEITLSELFLISRNWIKNQEAE